MSDITELERRLTAALDRVSIAVATKAETPAPSEEVEALKSQITDLEGLNEDLEEDKAQAQARVDRLESRVLRLADRLEDIEAEAARMREVIVALRAHADALTAANSAHMAATDRIDEGMAAELADLRAARAADLAQIDEILAELAPAVEEA